MIAQTERETIGMIKVIMTMKSCPFAAAMPGTGARTQIAAWALPRFG
jgi:hypothetical protein